MEIKGEAKETIHSSTPNPSQLLKLSNNDQVMPRLHSEFLFLFAHTTTQPNFMDTKLLKASLSRALATFFPLGGRLALRPDGGVDVDCCNKGALFVEAYTDARLEDYQQTHKAEVDKFEHHQSFPRFQPHPSWKALAPESDDELTEQPILLVQLTRFACGGAALGIRLHHHVADGAAFSHFVTSWAELSRGEEISVPPYLDRSALNAQHPPHPSFEHVEYVVNPQLIDWSMLVKLPKPAMTSKIFEFTSQDIQTLKERTQKGMEGGSFTGFEVLAGHTWQHLIKARGIALDCKLKLGMAVDGRKRFNPPLPQGYFGNVNFYGLAQSNAGELIRKPLHHAAACVQSATRKVTNEYMRSALDWIELQESPLSITGSFITPSDLAMTSWTRFSTYNTDFGWGKPVFFGVPNYAFQGLVILLPSPLGGGAVNVLVGLLIEHMSALESDSEFYPVTRSSK